MPEHDAIWRNKVVLGNKKRKAERLERDLKKIKAEIAELEAAIGSSA